MNDDDPGRVVHGSVRAVRTFRLTFDGRFWPIGVGSVWTSRVNSASCDLYRRPGSGPHVPPEPGCRCGFWAFGSLQGLRDSASREQATVVAVISCHGRVVPGTLGLRAQHATVDALWLSPEVSDAIRERVAGRYPAAATYRSVPAMLAEHPLSVLPSYRLPAVPRRLLVHLQLAVTLAWWLLMLVWSWLAPAAPAALGHTLVKALAVPTAVAVLTALVVLSNPHRWPWGLVGIAVQSFLLAGGQLVGYGDTRQQLALLLWNAGLVHLAVAGRVWWLLLGQGARGRLGPWTPGGT